MDIYMIWARDSFDGSVWLVDAWDDDSIPSNDYGWQEALDKARQAHGADNVRVVVSGVDINGIQAAFDVPRVDIR